MQKAVLQYMNYGARYKGNFIESLEYLEEELKQKDLCVVYMIISSQAFHHPPDWVEQMKRQGKKVMILSDEGKDNTSQIKRVIKEEGIALIHTHFITMKQYITLFKAVMFGNIPVLMHMHSQSKEAKNPVKAWLRRRLYNRCVMIACGPSVYQGLERIYPGIKKHTVNNGVQFDRLDQYEELDGSEFGFDKEENVCLIFGADFYIKGVDRALKALSGLRKKGEHYSLLISVSRDPDKVKAQVSEVLGEVPEWVTVVPARNDVASLYRYAKVFLSPSREEGLPYSVIEAAYCPCMVVLSDILPQIILDIPYGYWFEEDNIEEFQQQLLRAVEEYPNKGRELEQVQSRVKETYSLSIWRENICRLYMEHLKKS